MNDIVACVRTGEKYGVEYVERLLAGITRYYDQPFEFVCLTDRPDDIKSGNVDVIDISSDHLDGWWGKLTLFKDQWRHGHRVIYMDLDSVPVGKLNPLFEVPVYNFIISANFTRMAGNMNWPCMYGSAFMSLGPWLGDWVWKRFVARREFFLDRYKMHGDQMVIEVLTEDHPVKVYQDYLPKDFLLGYRHLREERPKNTGIVVFAGNHKPHNCDIQWVKDAWEGKYGNDTC